MPLHEIKHKIKYIAKYIPDAYHGTRLDKARRIIQEKKFIINRNPNHFLGDGAYFFEGSRWHAHDWARRLWGDVDLGLIRAYINLGKCLDLNNYNHRALLKKVRIELVRRNISDITDAVVINFYATKIEHFDTVRAPYTTPEVGRIYPESKFYDYSQLMICVRNQERILKLTLVFQGRQYHDREF
ncbi:MAG TPA: hypothetical protein VMW42_01920 [Desulfatiglandales bacterium]|nr:hypothetical protein [Desulfatiglandales bacterium]